MPRSAEQLEREIETARNRLADDLGELRLRITPGQVVDQLVDYARRGPAAEFFSNLGREIRQNPLPLLLTTAGLAWLVLASTRSRAVQPVVVPGQRASAVPASGANTRSWDESVVSPVAVVAIAE